MRTAGLILALALVGLAPRAFSEEPARFRLRAEGLLDLRAVRTGDASASLDAGLGKLRYGGDGSDGRTLFSVAQASLVLRASYGPALSARVHLNLDPDGHPTGGLNGVDVVEAFLLLTPRLTDTFSLRVRAGLLFPPISLENDGPAWTATRTRTPSAINSWISEEVRPTALETTLRVSFQRSDLDLTFAVFGWNDPDGSLVAWRGWALSDRQTALSDRLPLANVPTFRPIRDFPVQVPWIAPVREVDGRAGWYAGAAWKVPEVLELRLLRYDNRGDLVSVVRGQYAWETRFWAGGVSLPLGKGFELLGQGVLGHTRMGFGAPVDVDFRAAYGLASVALGPHRLTVRYDTFRNRDEKPTAAGESFDEDGSSWTGAWLLQTGPAHSLALEVVSVRSDRPARRELGLPPSTRETQLTLSFRARL